MAGKLNTAGPWPPGERGRPAAAARALSINAQSLRRELHPPGGRGAMTAASGGNAPTLAHRADRRPREAGAALMTVIIPTRGAAKSPSGTSASAQTKTLPILMTSANPAIPTAPHGRSSPFAWMSRELGEHVQRTPGGRELAQPFPEEAHHTFPLALQRDLQPVYSSAPCRPFAGKERARPAGSLSRVPIV